MTKGFLGIFSNRKKRADMINITEHVNHTRQNSVPVQHLMVIVAASLNQTRGTFSRATLANPADVKVKNIKRERKKRRRKKKSSLRHPSHVQGCGGHHHRGKRRR